MISANNYFDQVSLGLLFLAGFSLMILGLELGYRFGSRWLGLEAKAQPAQVRALMGGGLGLLGFMLAFSFSISQGHFEYRTQAYLQEVSAISSTYMSANFLPEPQAEEARELLRDFVNGRVQIVQHIEDMQWDEIYQLIGRSEEIHEKLWGLGQLDGFQSRDSTARLFSESVMLMIDANEQRKQAALYNRISPIIWLMLTLIAFLAMLITGYQAGLTGSHSRLATWSLAIIFAAVMAMVIDMDRPRMSLFEINDQQMLDLQKFMQRDHRFTVPSPQ